MSRNGKILAVLLVLLTVSVVYRLMNPFRQETVSELTYTGKSSSVKKIKKASRTLASEQGLKKAIFIDLFVNPPRHDDKVIRNMFVLEEKKPPEAALEPQSLTEPLPEPVDQMPSTPDTQIQQAVQAYHVFGFFHSGKEKIFFMERGKDVLSVRQGDLIDGKYIIESITGDQMVLRSRETGMQATLEIN